MFLNSIPVIGHVKGVVHYVKGDKEKGRRAICEATRTAVVIGGGVAGAVAGPAGAAIVAAAGGVLLDSVASIANNEPLGVCGNINSIINDVRKGKPPIAAALEAGITMGADLLTGGALGALTSGTSKAAGSSAGKKVTRSIGKALKKTLSKKLPKNVISEKALTVGAAIAEAAVTQIQSISPKRAPLPTTETASSVFVSSSDNLKDSSGSGIRSPSVNKSKIKKRCSLKMTKSIEILTKPITEKSLKDICIEGDYIFKELGPDEQEVFYKRVHNLKRQGYNADHIIKITTELFKNLHNPGENIDYKNFLLEMDFVATYVGEQVDRLNDLRHHDAEILQEFIANELTTNERLRQLTDTITTNLLSPSAITVLKDVTIDYLVSTFRTIQSQIAEIIIQPNFQNVYSAVRNYYMNRYVPVENREIPVSEYFVMIKCFLNDIVETRDYKKLHEGEISDMQIEIRIGDVGKASIVLRNARGTVIISSILFSY